MVEEEEGGPISPYPSNCPPPPLLILVRPWSTVYSTKEREVSKFDLPTEAPPLPSSSIFKQ